MNCYFHRHRRYCWNGWKTVYYSNSNISIPKFVNGSLVQQNRYHHHYHHQPQQQQHELSFSIASRRRRRSLCFGVVPNTYYIRSGTTTTTTSTTTTSVATTVTRDIIRLYHPSYSSSNHHHHHHSYPLVTSLVRKNQLLGSVVCYHHHHHHNPMDCSSNLYYWKNNKITRRFFWSKFHTILQRIFQMNDNDASDSRNVLERYYLYYAILLTKWRSLRIHTSVQNKNNNNNKIISNKNCTNTTSNDATVVVGGGGGDHSYGHKVVFDGNNESKNDEALESTNGERATTTTTTTNVITEANRTNARNELDDILFDQAVNDLQLNSNIDQQKNIDLRILLQNEFQSQIDTIFHAFYQVDKNLHVSDVFLPINSSTSDRTSKILNSMNKNDKNNNNNNNSNNNSNIDQNQPQDVMELVENYSDMYKLILLEDFEQTRMELDHLLQILSSSFKLISSSDATRTEEKQRQQLSFLFRKLSALEVVLDFHDWRQQQQKYPSILNQSSQSHYGYHYSDILSLTNWNTKLDPFGVVISDTLASSRTKKQLLGDDQSDSSTMVWLRYYQTINLCRSALIKKHVGFSVLSLQSTIPNAGRGTFIDGGSSSGSGMDEHSKPCYAGSIVAFQPGITWCQEHLTSDSMELVHHFQHDPDCHVSIRFDGHVIDSRQCPVTDLVGDQMCPSTSNPNERNKFNNNTSHHNPWALGHIVNHPSANQRPNTLSCLLNYSSNSTTNRMYNNPDERSHHHYVPNKYALQPSWKTKLFDYVYNNKIMMHGLCLIATEDLHHQELFYDYRLQQDEVHNPPWYTIVQYPEDSYFGSYDTNQTNNNNNNSKSSSSNDKSTSHNPFLNWQRRWTPPPPRDRLMRKKTK